MSTCTPENSTAFGFDQSIVKSWQSGRDLVLDRTFGRVRRLFATWQSRRRLRRDLRGLPDYLLRDVGLEVEAARLESDKPFWQA